MGWDAVIGQTLALRLLRRALESDRVSHAYLLVGPSGVGKRTIARLFASALLCRSFTPELGPCGSCSSCTRITSLPSPHPDVHYVEPDGRYIKTDQIRLLQTELYARPAESSRRVAVIEAADRMNAEAGNRLLKLLEEPPAYVVMILVTENLAGVLPTIISRCQIVNCSPVGTEEIVTLLVRNGLDPKTARLYSMLSGGSVGRALRLQESPQTLVARDEAYQFIHRLTQVDDFDLVGLSETMEKKKHDLDEWLDLLLIWLRDALVAGVSDRPGLIVNADKLAEVSRIAVQFGPAGIFRLITAITQARDSLQKNANTRLTLDVMMLSMVEAASYGRV